MAKNLEDALKALGSQQTDKAVERGHFESVPDLARMVGEMVHTAIAKDPKGASELTSEMQSTEIIWREDGQLDPANDPHCHAYAHAWNTLSALAGDSGVYLGTASPAIWQKIIDIGMMTEAVNAVLGRPDSLGRRATPQTIHETTIQNYLEVGAMLTKVAAGKDESAKHARAVWPIYRQARVYEFDPLAVVDLFHEVDTPMILDHEGKQRQYQVSKALDIVSDKVAAGEWQVDELAWLDEKGLDVSRVGFHDTPFDVCWFGYGPGIRVPQKHIWTIGGDIADVVKPHQELNVIGDLVRYDGMVHQFAFLVSGDFPNVEVEGMLHYPVRTPEKGWEQPWCLTAHTVPEILRQIDEVRTIVEETGRMGLASKFKKMSKGLPIKKRTPPPYYKVSVNSKYIVRRDKGLPSREVDWSHRWDVESHYRHLIRRGPLPLDSEEHIKLVTPNSSGNAYEVWERGVPPGWVQEVLAERLMPPKKPNEWLAVMKIRIPATIKGPDDKPYIPASRKVKSNKKKAKDSSAEPLSR